MNNHDDNDPISPPEEIITFPIDLPRLSGREALALVAILDSIRRQIWQVYEGPMTIALIEDDRCRMYGPTYDPDEDSELESLREIF